jgi:hypothetical protein
MDQGSHFYRFRPGAEKEENSHVFLVEKIFSKRMRVPKKYHIIFFLKRGMRVIQEPWKERTKWLRRE